MVADETLGLLTWKPSVGVVALPAATQVEVAPHLLGQLPPVIVGLPRRLPCPGVTLVMVTTASVLSVETRLRLTETSEKLLPLRQALTAVTVTWPDAA